MEIYLNVKPTIFAEIVGFGPVINQKFSTALGFLPNQTNLPPLIVQTIDEKIFVCEFNQGKHVNDPESVNFDRDHITPSDFKEINMDYLMGSLIMESKPIHFNLGDSWDSERFFSWRVESSDYLSKLPKPFLESALSLGDGYKIARRLELLYEWELFQKISERSKVSEREARHKEWLSERKGIFDGLAVDIPWLVSYESNRISTGKIEKKPGLDFYDNN